MNAMTPYLAGVVLTAFLGALVVVTLDRPLRTVLVELCGTRGRAGFWSAVSRVVLVAVPLILALNVQPDPDSDLPVVLAMATQLKWGLVGVVLATVVLALLLAAFITTAAVFPAPPPDAANEDRVASGGSRS